MSDVRQLDLLAWRPRPAPFNRKRNVDTSRAGAVKIAPQAAAMRARILDLIRKSPDGMTSDEIGRAIGKGPQTVSGRLWELRCQDMTIEDSGRRRAGRSGVAQRIYVATKGTNHG